MKITEVEAIILLPLEEGYVKIPTDPGLGVDLDPEILERCAIGERPIPVDA